MQKIVVCGQSRLTTAVIERLLRSPLGLQVAIPAADEAELPMATLTVISGLTENHLHKATTKTWATTDVLVVTDYGDAEAEAWQADMLEHMRKVIAAAMAAGFGGKILIATHDDAVMTYFAQRFSGLAKDTVIGLGTFGVSECFEQTLATQLKVPRSRVTAYVLGTSAEPVLIWSRAYVASSPVLSLLQIDGVADTLLADTNEACLAYAQADGSLLWPPLVERLLAAFAGQALMAPLMTIAEQVACTLTLVNDDGIQPVVSLHGAEAEESALAAIRVQLAATIQGIEKGTLDE